MCLLPDTTSLFHCFEKLRFSVKDAFFWTADSRHLFAVKYDIGGFLVEVINLLKKNWLHSITQIKTQS